MDLNLDLDSIFNGFGSGFGFKCVLGLDWILDLKKFMDLDLDLDLFLDMDSNPNPRIQIRTSLPSSSHNLALKALWRLGSGSLRMPWLPHEAHKRILAKSKKGATRLSP